MEQLKVIGTEDDVLVVATEAGERFALPLDEVLRAERAARAVGASTTTSARPVRASARHPSAHRGRALGGERSPRSWAPA